MEKKLYKNDANKKLCGVCSGLAEYFGIDVTLVRVGWALFGICAGTGILAYFVCAAIMPSKPKNIIDAE